MQRAIRKVRTGYATRAEVRRDVLHFRKLAGPQPSGPAITQPVVTYLVRVRNTPEGQRQAWAAYIKALRGATGMSTRALADRLGVDPATVWRWETAKTKPESTAVPERIAELFKVSLDEVLTAAGLKPTVDPAPEPTIEPDPEIDAILRSGLPRRIQDELVAFVEQQREQDRQRRLETLHRTIRLAGGRVA